MPAARRAASDSQPELVGCGHRAPEASTWRGSPGTRAGFVEGRSRSCAEKEEHVSGTLSGNPSVTPSHATVFGAVSVRRSGSGSISATSRRRSWSSAAEPCWTSLSEISEPLCVTGSGSCMGATEHTGCGPDETSAQELHERPWYTPAGLALVLIRGYQAVRAASPYRWCRFEPTCSSFTATAVARFGLIRGLFLGVRRILRCNPWSAGGYDPVPEAMRRRA